MTDESTPSPSAPSLQESKWAELVNHYLGLRRDGVDADIHEAFRAILTRLADDVEFRTSALAAPTSQENEQNEIPNPLHALARETAEKLHNTGAVCLLSRDQCERIIEAALLHAQQVQRWQPIATCPGPGTTVLLWGGGWRSPFPGWSLGDFGHCWIDGSPGFEMWGATHWMPMPDLPLATLRSQETP